MKKRNLIIMGLMALATTAVSANAAPAAKVEAPAACSASACQAEAAFVAKLSKAQAEAFAKMTAQQKAAVLALKDVAPDAAVDQVSKQVAHVVPEKK